MDFLIERTFVRECSYHYLKRETKESELQKLQTEDLNSQENHTQHF